MTVFEPRARRTRLFCDAYGLTDRRQLVDMVLERQLAAHTAIEQGAKAGNTAYQQLWELGAGDGIQQQIAYVELHCSELDGACGSETYG